MVKSLPGTYLLFKEAGVGAGEKIPGVGQKKDRLRNTGYY